MKLGLVLGLLVAAGALGPRGARADYLDDYYTERGGVGSPEMFALELRIGPYVPDVGNSSFTDTFGSDDGLLLATEVDVLPLRIPYFGLVGGGLGFGWAGYSAKARGADGNTVDEETELDLLPLSVLGVVRVDVLARELGIPIILTGKIGADYVMWSSSTGSADDGEGADLGLRWALQAAFELDILDRHAARALDEEWGINHSFAFIELFGTKPDGAPPMGDTTWAAGLGFVM